MSKKRVLIADDDIAICEMIKTGLEVMDYIVDISTNESEIWAAIKANKPDVILMDIAMPGIDGISLCRNIRFSPELSQIPIIIVTAFSDERTFHDAMLFGANDFISKPFEISEVKKKIEDSIARPDRKSEPGANKQ